MLDRSFLHWPFFEERHRALSDRLEAWAAQHCTHVDHHDVDAACRELVRELGREPTTEEIAKKMGMSVEKVSKARKLVQQPVSLETPIGESGDSQLGDLIEDKSSTSPAERVITSNLREITGDVLQTLSPREERVIRMRFGLDREGHERTLEEVGQDFNVTRERIRQIEAKALRKLRHPSRSRKLKSFVESL